MPIDAEYKHRWYLANKERLAEKKHAAYLLNRETICEKQRAYCRAHKTEQAAYRRSWAEANREKIAEKKHAYYERNKESISQQQRAYRATHVEERRTHEASVRASRRQKALAYRREYYASERGRLLVLAGKHRRYARKRGAVGADYTTASMISARCALWGNRCWICGKPMEAIDHVKPLAKGGAHLPCNLRPICRSCNASKNDKWPFNVMGAYLGLV